MALAPSSVHAREVLRLSKKTSCSGDAFATKPRSGTVSMSVSLQILVEAEQFLTQRTPSI